MLTRRTIVGGSAGVIAGTSLAGSSAARASSVDAHAKFAWRIKHPNWASDASYAALRRLLVTNSSVVDEVSFMESPGTSVFPPQDIWSQTASALAPRIGDLKNSGVKSVGINVLVTLGHGPESAPPATPLTTLPGMVGHDGAVSQSCPCPTQPEYHEYIRAKYSTLSLARPDFIWVDDDFRMMSHGLTWPCFCSTCLGMFAGEIGRTYTRQQLVEAFDRPQNGALRRLWVDHNAQVLQRLCTIINQAVRSVDPSIVLGLMTVGMELSDYGGSDYERWMPALGATKVRPGHGYYSDWAPRYELLSKAAGVARQIAAMPEGVSDRQYEHETWPDGSLFKSPATALNEVVLALVAGGCNGVAFDSLGWGGPFEEYQSLFDRMASARPYVETLAAQVENVPSAGVWSAWTPRLMDRRTLNDGDTWLQSTPPGGRYDPTLSLAPSMIGMPLTAFPGQRSALLTGGAAEGLDDAQLRAILRGGVLMDTLALRVLEARGLGALTGVRVAASYPIRWSVGMTIARLTAHPLNGSYAGAVHNSGAMVPPDFAMADVLAPLDEGVMTLARLEEPVSSFDPAVVDRGPCTTAFENSEGGRVVVFGHSPWFWLFSVPMRHQMLAAADWISRNTMPVKIIDPVSLTPFVRLDAAGARGAILLMNTGLEPIERVRILARVSGALRLASPDPGPSMRRFSNDEGPGFEIRNIPAWSTVAALIG